jgi:hypothetical protein
MNVWLQGIISTVQETKTGKDKEYSKYTTPIPNAIIDLKGIKKGDKLKWTFDNGNIILEIIKEG